MLAQEERPTPVSTAVDRAGRMGSGGSGVLDPAARTGWHDCGRRDWTRRCRAASGGPANGNGGNGPGGLGSSTTPGALVGGGAAGGTGSKWKWNRRRPRRTRLGSSRFGGVGRTGGNLVAGGPGGTGTARRPERGGMGSGGLGPNGPSGTNGGSRMAAPRMMAARMAAVRLPGAGRTLSAAAMNGTNNLPDGPDGSDPNANAKPPRGQGGSPGGDLLTASPSPNGANANGPNGGAGTDGQPGARSDGPFELLPTPGAGKGPVTDAGMPGELGNSSSGGDLAVRRGVFAAIRPKRLPDRHLPIWDPGQRRPSCKPAPAARRRPRRAAA